MTRVTVITNSLIEGELIPHVNSIGNRTRISTADNYKKKKLYIVENNYIDMYTKA